jgi:hypothetical protein
LLKSATTLKLKIMHKRPPSIAELMEQQKENMPKRRKTVTFAVGELQEDPTHPPTHTPTPTPAAQRELSAPGDSVDAAAEGTSKSFMTAGELWRASVKKQHQERIQKQEAAQREGPAPPVLLHHKPRCNTPWGN